MSSEFDSVILIGFGGPTRGCCRRFAECPGEVICFVQGIVGGRAGSEERIREVAAHYESFGGLSPFNYLSQKQAGALETALELAGVRAPVYVGYRFWAPYVKDAVAEMHRCGLRRALGVILASRHEVIPDRQRSTVLEARQGNPRELGSRRVDEKSRQAKAALQRPLGDVGVLDTIARHGDHLAPQNPAADLNALLGQTIGEMAVLEDGPDVAQHGQGGTHHHPEGEDEERDDQ